MIFISKNEAGVPAWKLVKNGKKTVTRRRKPEIVGSLRAVCPGRGKKAVCHVRVISCMPHRIWFDILLKDKGKVTTKMLDKEAIKEGFKTWRGLTEWFKQRGDLIDNKFRIEFKLEGK